jgi:hypothetical protein
MESVLAAVSLMSNERIGFYNVGASSVAHRSAGHDDGHAVGITDSPTQTETGGSYKRQ